MGYRHRANRLFDKVKKRVTINYCNYYELKNGNLSSEIENNNLFL